MRSRWKSIVARTAVLAILSFAPMLAAVQAGQRGQGSGGAGAAPGGQRGQRGPQAPTGPAPRLTSGKPDLSGLWNQPYVPDMTRINGTTQIGMGQLPFTEWGEKEWKSYDPVKNGDYTGNCYPFGMSRSINSPHPIQIMQKDDSIAFLFEQNSWFIWIPTDGREHLKGSDLIPTWFGDSVGKWDGDTLVIDTIGFNGWTRLDTIGHPHSDQLHIIQTFKRADLGHIEHTITIDDPKTYTMPWKNTRIWTLRPASDRIMEYSCEENNLGADDGTIVKWRPPVDSRKN